MHSQYVIDRIKSEVIPIFATYGLEISKENKMCQLNNFDMVKEHLKQFAHKKSFKSSHRCQLCDKNFENEDYLEFHMKSIHFRD